MVIGDNTVSYSSNKVQINGAIAGVTTSVNHTEYAAGNLNAVVTLHKDVTFCLHMQVMNTPVEVAGYIMPDIPDNLLKPTATQLAGIEGTVRIKIADFTVAESR